METQSPFSWAAQALPDLAVQAAQRFGTSFQPPKWLVDETINRLVLFLNHVLMSEPEALSRLARQKGQRIELVWGQVQLQLSPTAAGLLERVRFEGFDLRLNVTESSPISMVTSLAQGDKPKVRIEGDVQLAAEINWLFDHVRWDAEEDLARLIGDAPAHTLAEAARQAIFALRGFVAKRPGNALRTGGSA